MDEPCNYHMFQRLMADEEKWAQVQDPTSEGYARYHGMLYELICFAERLRGLRQLIAMLTEKCLEPLKRRNSSAYAEAYSYFYIHIVQSGRGELTDDALQLIGRTRCQTNGPL